MDLNSIFLKFNTFEDINHNILSYFIESTSSAAGIICYHRIKENNLDVISFLNFTNDNIELIKKECINTTEKNESIYITNTSILVKHNISPEENLFVYLTGKEDRYNASDIKINDLKIISSYVPKLFINGINIKYYNSVLDNSDELIMFIKQKNIIFLNGICEKLLEYNASEIFTKNILEIIHIDDLEEITSNLESSLTDKAVFRMISKTGNIIYVSAKFIYISKEFYLLILCDITSHIVIEKSKNESISSLCSYVISQLNGVHGFCQLAKLDTEDFIRSNDNIKLVSKLSNLLTNLNTIKDIAETTVSNIHNNFEGLPIESADYDIDNVIKESFEMMTNLFMIKKIDLYYNKKYSRIKCSINRKKLLQAIINIQYFLLDDFGHDFINISLVVLDGNKNVAITFSCGNNLHKSEIILYVSQEKQLAWKQYTFGINSDIKISDTKIQLIVPIILTKDNLSIISGIQYDTYDKLITHNEKKILCIEDNESNIKLIRKIIEKYFNNVNMISTHHGYMGMDIIENHKFDLILLDLNLPDVRGEQIIKHIRESKINEECPICVMSSESTTPSMEKCFNMGCNYFITKPIQITRFKEIIEKYV